MATHLFYIYRIPPNVSRSQKEADATIRGGATIRENTVFAKCQSEIQKAVDLRHADKLTHTLIFHKCQFSIDLTC